MPTGFAPFFCIRVRETVIFGILMIALAIGSQAAEPAPKLVFREWHAGDGLPTETPYCVVQSADGYMWISSFVGVVRFDGIRFVPMTIPELPLHGRNACHLLHASEDGSVWAVFSDAQSVVRWKGGRASLWNYSEFVFRVFPNSICEGWDHSLLLSFPGHGVIRVSDDAISLVPVEGDEPKTGYVAADENGKVWYATDSGIRELTNGVFQMREALPGPVSLIWRARGGGFWLKSGNYSAVRYIPGAASDREIRPPSGTGSINALYEDRDGVIWLGTRGSPESGLFRIQNQVCERVGDRRLSVVSIAPDHEGNIWLTTNDRGLLQVRVQMIRIATLAPGLAQGQIESFARDGANRIWASMDDGTVFRENGSGWEPVPPFHNPASSQAVCVGTAPDGTMLVGSRNGLFSSRGDKLARADFVPKLKDQNVIGIYTSRAKDLWIFYRGGKVNRVRDGIVREWELPGRSDARTFAEDAEGGIVIAPTGGKLFRVIDDRLDEIPFESAGNDPIRALWCDFQKNIWIGFLGGGLGRLKAGSFIRANSANGLSDDYISQLFADELGRLWINSHTDLSSLDISDFEAFASGRNKRLRVVSYSRAEEELADPTLFHGATYGWALIDEEVWFSAGNRVLIVNPRARPINRTPPPVTIEVFRTDGEEVTGSEIRIPPSHRKLEFEFAALSYTSPGNNHFRYKLEGYDTEWVEAGTRRQVAYSRLAAGPYRFRVTASNGDGVWNHEGSSIAFAVTPHFWQTTWFRVSLLLAAVGLGIAISRGILLARLQRKLRDLEQEQVLATERSRIARDIHDDLGSSLGQIALFGELARNERVPAVEREGYVGKMADAARRLTKTPNQLVWAVNPRNDTLTALATYLAEHATEYLHAAQIRVLLEISRGLPEHPIKSVVRHNVLLAIREALHNVVKHSRATQVVLRLSWEEPIIWIELKDNGCGFDPLQLAGHGNGLRNMADRAREIGADFNADSIPGTGTRLTIRVDLSRA